MSAANSLLKYTVRGVAKTLDMALLKPTRLPTGRWSAPKLSAMKLATIRKSVLKSGSEWPLDKPPVVREVKYKGQKHLIDQKKRFEQINEKMKEMPKKIEDYYAAIRARRIHIDDPRYVMNNGYGRMK